MSITKTMPISEDDREAARAQREAARVQWAANNDRKREIDHEIAELEESTKKRIDTLKAERDLLSEQNGRLKDIL